MNTFKWRYLTILVAGLVGAGQAAWAGNDSPQALDASRRVALEHLGAGERTAAATHLLTTLREIPPERSDLAPPAVGLAQVLLFNTEYLMHPEERRVFFTETLNEAEQPMDKLLATLMRYSDDAGISVEEAERCAQDLYKLTRSENQVVRLGALFTMSSPYFLYDTGWAQTARDRIVAEFPDSELALEAQRLPLYRAEQWGDDGLDLLFNAADQKGELRAHSKRLREDALGQALFAHLEARNGAREDGALAADLDGVLAGAPGWMEQYAALSILADLDRAKTGPRVREAATDAITRAVDPRVAFRARTLRLIQAREQGDAATLVEDCGALLDNPDIPLVYERNNHEELMHHTRQSAARLAELGRTKEATALLQRLADRYPGSALADELRGEIQTIADRDTVATETATN